MDTAKKERRRKSERLTPVEHAAFIEWYKSQDTKIDASEKIGLSVVTLDAIELKGSGHPSSLIKIRSILAHVPAA